MQIVLWDEMQPGNVGNGYSCPHYPIKSVQVIGTFGGATVYIQGSNIITDPTYANLTYDGATAITFTVAGIKKIFENTYFVRPYVSGGDATTNLKVYLSLETER